MDENDEIRFIEFNIRELGLQKKDKKAETKKIELTKDEIDDFWNKIDKVDKVNPDDECWEWKGSKIKSGHGIYYIKGLGKYLMAHRISYELLKDHIPKNLSVYHRCNNPSCVNPKHLFLSTQKDFMIDASKKGILDRFTEEEKSIIRELYSTGYYSYGELARISGVHSKTIRNVIKKKLRK